MSFHNYGLYQLYNKSMLNYLFYFSDNLKEKKNSVMLSKHCMILIHSLISPISRCSLAVCLSSSLMYLVEEHYYTINKTVLKGLGIWPHDKSRLAFLRRMLFLTLAVTYIALQLAVFITSKYNMNLFVKTMSLAFPSILFTLKYITFMFRTKTMKNLHHRMREDWKLMQNKIEHDIIKKCAHDCQNYIIFISQSIAVLIIILVIIQFLPVTLDFIWPLDEPRSHKPIITVEYFIFQDDHFYIATFHQTIIVALFTAIMIATGTTLLLFALHSFGMFKIASHRIKHSIDNYVIRMPNCEMERTIYKRIIHVIIAHRRAMEFSNILVSALNVPYCTIVIIGVFSLSINLFRFVQAVTISMDIEDILVSFSAVFGHLVYMFIAIYVGQKATDHNDELFRLTYDTSWYLIPVTSQKLILFLITRTGKEFYYTLGYIFVAKIENFAMLLNTALSYVAVMYSIQ
ncbi:odorant receptor 9a isoform X2 [Solenopsis invicta]|uniref:odorant receptor 9a isoform X2 n=1 Tax=Solenopsis invicta TaxID=13686 RepID=UPI00193E3EC0|nr:odorant receptor 9a isoform X2 [Solenopsis invicta]